MNVVIRPVGTHAAYQAIEQVQLQAWGMPAIEVVPGSMLLTAQRHGGLVLGAFTPDDQLVGFAFGFVGRDKHGRIHHHSHQTAVMPAFQHANIGYHLKLAQREHVLQQGIPMITWTFDPLQSRNAYLNIHKLGATCCTYLPDLYGTMPDARNAGLPSDRFEVEWHLESTHVTQRLGAPPADRPAQLADVPLLNPEPLVEPDHARTATLLQHQRVLIEIPANIEAIKAANIDHAQAWRRHTRALFAAAFAAGYTVTDLFVGDGRSYYVLEHFWRPDEDRTR
jgi:predicted GNAT superfamily acetyltransferase